MMLDGSHASYCKKCYNAWKRGRYKKNREKEVARVMDYNYRNYDRFKERLSKYRKTDKWKEVRAKWENENQDLVKEYGRRKRAKRLKAQGSHTKDDVLRILDMQKNKCAEPTCKKDLSDGYHVDHIMPLALGGSDWPENLQCLCASCNTHKCATHPIDWARKKGRLL